MTAFEDQLSPDQAALLAHIKDVPPMAPPSQQEVDTAVAAAIATDPRILTGGPDAYEPAPPRPVQSDDRNEAATAYPVTEPDPAPTVQADAAHGSDAEAVYGTERPVAQVTTERVITKQPAFGAFALGPDGMPVWPPQPVLDDLHGPEQTYWDIPPDAVYWSDAARLIAEGWKVPIYRLHEVIAQREAFRQAIQQAAARRSDTGPIVLALRKAADVTADTDPVPAIVAAIEGAALDLFMSANLGVEGSRINAISHELETSYRTLLFENQRAVLASLIGRDSPAATKLRALVESMAGQLTLAPMMPTAWVVYP